MNIWRVEKWKEDGTLTIKCNENFDDVFQRDN